MALSIQDHFILTDAIHGARAYNRLAVSCIRSLRVVSDFSGAELDEARAMIRERAAKARAIRDDLMARARSIREGR